MKVRLVPLYFDPGRDEDFDKQLSALDSLFGPSQPILQRRQFRLVSLAQFLDRQVTFLRGQLF